MKMFVTFERGRDGKEPLTLGPFDFVQLTYGELRISPDGETLAYNRNGDWFLLRDVITLDTGINEAIEAYDSKYHDRYFSDVIILAEPMPGQ